VVRSPRARLPRAAWLAIGAIAAALGVDAALLGVGATAALAVVVGVLALSVAIALARRRRAVPAVLLLAFGSVAVRAGLGLLLVGGGPAVAPPVGATAWLGRVTDVSAPAGMDQRAFLELTPTEAPDATWTVYAWLPRHPGLVRGDVVRLEGSIEPAPRDGGGFAGFLAARGASGTVRARSVELVSRGAGAAAAIEQLRWDIDALLARILPEPEAGLAAGILVGLRERVARETADDFTATGLTHVVAISGWNIALVAGIATGLLRATGLGRRPRSLLVIIAIAGYTLLAGAEASVVRAAVMGGVVLIAREGGYPAGAAAALGLACWGLLLAEPAMIGDIGLQLSLAATAGLLALGGASERAVARVTRGHAPRWFCETLGVSLAAQLATLPLILLHFGRLSLISPLANLVIAPVVPLAMLGAAAAVPLGFVGSLPGILLAPISLPAWLPLAVMTRVGDVLAAVPFASVALPAPSGLAGALGALLALLAVLRHAHPAYHATGAGTAGGELLSSPVAKPPGTDQRRRRVALAVSGVLVAVVSSVLVARPLPQLRITVLDVGQGDAILIEASGGGRVLVDGGSDPDLLVRRLDERIPIWDRRIDLVVLTHPHEDHAGGLGGLMPRYRVTRIAETGMASDGAGTRALRATAVRLGVSRVRLTQGDAFAIGEARVDVLWPPLAGLPARAPSTGRAINDTSIVLALGLGQQRALLTGDLEEDRDDDLLAVLADDGRRWDVLKVAHHGSAGASSQALLERLRPRLALISSGVGNDYGHPATATLERLDSVGSVVRRTDLEGSIAVELDGGPAPVAAAPGGPLTGCRVPHTATPTTAAGRRSACYARVDGRPHSSRGALLAHVHGSLATPGAAPHGRGGGGLLPGRARRPCRPAGRPPPRRDGRAPPRCRQGPPPRPPPA
jgi:competence protein ComEC